MMQLSDVRQDVIDSGLPLEDEALNLVFGRGSADAAAFIVGEAPGEQEDRQGEPFVGRSGQVLSDVLDEVGLDEGKDVYIANVVKYRPPENRDPYVDEIREHAPYLLEQIRIVNPEIIVSLGNTAGEFFFDEDAMFSGISQERGDPFTTIIHEEQYVVFPTYHPAATLYDRSLRGDFVDDLKAVRRRIS